MGWRRGQRRRGRQRPAARLQGWQACGAADADADADAWPTRRRARPPAPQPGVHPVLLRRHPGRRGSGAAGACNRESLRAVGACERVKGACTHQGTPGPRAAEPCAPPPTPPRPPPRRATLLPASSAGPRPPSSSTALAKRPSVRAATSQLPRAAPAPARATHTARTHTCVPCLPLPSLSERCRPVRPGPPAHQPRMVRCQGGGGRLREVGAAAQARHAQLQRTEPRVTQVSQQLLRRRRRCAGSCAGAPRP